MGIEAISDWMNREDLPKKGVVPALKSSEGRGSGVAQSVECPTPDFSLGHDLTVCEFEPHTGLFTDSVEPAWDSLSTYVLPLPSLSKVNK